MEDRNLSLSAVAGTLGVSERTVRRWIQSGKLKAYKPGRDYRIPESAVRELVEESEISPKAESRSSLEPTLLNGLEEERPENPLDVALGAAKRQAVQDRQAFNRAAESERPQTYFARHENEAAMELLKYPAGELAGALLEAAAAFENERRKFIVAKAIAAAAERWVGITSGGSSDDENASGVYLAAADLEGLLSVEVGDYEAWEKLSDGERSEIATVMAALGRVTEGYHEQREAEQDTERRRALVRQWTRELTESA